MSSDVIQMTTNYCVSTSPCCPASADQTNIKLYSDVVPRVPEKALAIAQTDLPTHKGPGGLDKAAANERRLPR